MTEESRLETGHPGPAPQRILVVDDDPVSLQTSLEVLALCGYVADGALDGVAGWDALRAQRYSLLITDNVMPKVTGVELVKLLRERDTALPVIMATGVIPTEEIKRHPELAINAFLVKPFTVDLMLETVSKLLGEKSPG